MLLVLASLLFVVWALHAIDLLPGLDRVGVLSQVAPFPKSYRYPPVSVVIPAHNVEMTLGLVLPSILHQNYPSFEVIVVNDRSSDHTSLLLDDFASRYPNLRVITLTELPDGWLGKNHALQVGAQHSKSQWILFTEGDVNFEPDALCKAISHVESHHLDHLCSVPPMDELSVTLGSTLAAVMTLFLVFMRPLSLTPQIYGGLGSLDLVRTDSYRQFGGHAQFPLRHNTALSLGELMRSRGGKYDCLVSGGSFRFSWSTCRRGTVDALLDGLGKDVFESFDEKPVSSTLLLFLHLLALFLPCFALPLSDGLSWWLFFGAFLLELQVTIKTMRVLGANEWLSFLSPLACIFIAYCLIRAALGKSAAPKGARMIEKVCSASKSS